MQCYERSAAWIFKQHDVYITPNQEVQFKTNYVNVANNNPCNLNGKKTFHYLGMTMASTPFSDCTFRIVPRYDVSNDQLKDLSSQMVTHFNKEEIKELDGVKYKQPMNVEESKYPYILLDLLWKFKQITSSNTPLWSATMIAVFRKSEKNIKSTVTFSQWSTSHQQSTDFACVYSTLKYIEEVPQKSTKVTVSTFDQALWLHRIYNEQQWNWCFIIDSCCKYATLFAFRNSSRQDYKGAPLALSYILLEKNFRIHWHWFRQ